MEILIALQVVMAPEHSVLPGAEKYDLRDLRLRWTMETGEAILEIEASTQDDYAVLRFCGVEDVMIPCGDLIGNIRLQIQDTSVCPSGSHGIPSVRVGGTKHDGLRFWAKSVTRLNAKLNEKPL